MITNGQRCFVRATLRPSYPVQSASNQKLINSLPNRALEEGPPQRQVSTSNRAGEGFLPVGILFTDWMSSSLREMTQQPKVATEREETPSKGRIVNLSRFESGRRADLLCPSSSSNMTRLVRSRPEG